MKKYLEVCKVFIFIFLLFFVYKIVFSSYTNTTIEGYSTLNRLSMQAGRPILRELKKLFAWLFSLPSKFINFNRYF
jgi:hypothetical protein